MKFKDWTDKEYTGRELIALAQKKWEENYRYQDYYFLQDYPRKIKSAETALNFLNNLYETEIREVSFKKI